MSSDHESYHLCWGRAHCMSHHILLGWMDSVHIGLLFPGCLSIMLELAISPPLMVCSIVLRIRNIGVTGFSPHGFAAWEVRILGQKAGTLTTQSSQLIRQRGMFFLCHWIVVPRVQSFCAATHRLSCSVLLYVGIGANDNSSIYLAFPTYNWNIVNSNATCDFAFQHLRIMEHNVIPEGSGAEKYGMLLELMQLNWGSVFCDDGNLCSTLMLHLKQYTLRSPSLDGEESLMLVRVLCTGTLVVFWWASPRSSAVGSFKIRATCHCTLSLHCTTSQLMDTLIFNERVWD